MSNRERIIVGVTTWHKRISNIPKVMDTILNQTIRPDFVVLSVCIQDFPRMYDDFPQDVRDYLSSHDKIRVKWFLENYKGWKKHLGVLEIATDADLIVCMDDDRLYPKDIIEKLYRSYEYYGKKHPITMSRGFLAFSEWSFCGWGSLYRKRDWGDYKKYFVSDVLHKCNEDELIHFIFAANKTVIFPSIYKMPDPSTYAYNSVDPLTTPAAFPWDTIEHRYMNDQLMDVYYRINGITDRSVNLFTPQMLYVFSKCIDEGVKEDYPAAKKIMSNIEENGWLTYVPVPDFVEKYLSNEL